MNNHRQNVYKFYSLLLTCIDWIFPPECAACGRENEHFCDECRQKIEYLPAHICKICGVPLISGEICGTCRQKPPAFDALRSVALYEGPIAQVVQKLKYHRYLGLGLPLAELIHQKIKQLMWQPDLVVPVPLSRERKQERGYNQAAVMANALSLLMNTAYSSTSLYRIRDTKSQVGLSAEKRLQNVIGAFKAEPSIAQYACVLLVDDVTTTGATMNACAIALKSQGVQKVLGITLAKSHHV